MTLPAAKKVFAHLMEVSRERELRPLEKRTLIRARQVIRQAKKNPLSPSQVRRKYRLKNKPKSVRIYAAITRIEGTKGTDSKYPRQKFYHNFKKPYPAMYGLADGSILIK